MAPLSTSPNVPLRQVLRHLLMVLLTTTGITTLISFVISLIMMSILLVILNILAPVDHAFGRCIQMLAVCVGACIFLHVTIFVGWLGALGRDWRHLAQIPRRVLFWMFMRYDLAAAISFVIWCGFGGLLISRVRTHTTSYVYLLGSLIIAALLIHIYQLVVHRLLHL